jgi:hypothetical protein
MCYRGLSDAGRVAGINFDDPCSNSNQKRNTSVDADGKDCSWCPAVMEREQQQ